MHKVTTALLASLISFTALHAENLVGFSASAGPAFPVRALKRLLGTGYAATGSIDFPLNDNISIVALGGYLPVAIQRGEDQHMARRNRGRNGVRRRRAFPGDSRDDRGEAHV